VRLIAVGDDAVRASLRGLSFVAAKVFLQRARTHIPPPV
jgi:hypothetical protein